MKQTEKQTKIEEFCMQRLKHSYYLQGAREVLERERERGKGGGNGDGDTVAKKGALCRK